MRAQSFAALAWSGFQESRRNRVTLVIAAFAVVMLMVALLLSSAAVAAIERVVVDVALGSMSLVLVVLTVFLSSGGLSRELERRTIYLVVSKPVSRGLFLLARQASTMLTASALLVGMMLVFGLELLLYQVPFHASFVAAAAGLWLELFLLCSVGLLFSTFSGQLVSLTATLGLYFAGHLAEDLYRLSSRVEVGAVRAVGKAVYYLLPNLERVNFRGRATYLLDVPAQELLAAAGYTLGYSAVVLALGVLIFARRDFK